MCSFQCSAQARGYQTYDFLHRLYVCRPSFSCCFSIPVSHTVLLPQQVDLLTYCTVMNHENEGRWFCLLGTKCRTTFLMGGTTWPWTKLLSLNGRWTAGRGDRTGVAIRCPHSAPNIFTMGSRPDLLSLFESQKNFGD